MSNRYQRFEGTAPLKIERMRQDIAAWLNGIITELRLSTPFFSQTDDRLTDEVCTRYVKALADELILTVKTRPSERKAAELTLFSLLGQWPR